MKRPGEEGDGLWIKSPDLENSIPFQFFDVSADMHPGQGDGFDVWPGMWPCPGLLACRGHPASARRRATRAGGQIGAAGKAAAAARRRTALSRRRGSGAAGPDRQGHRNVPQARRIPSGHRRGAQQPGRAVRLQRPSGRSPQGPGSRHAHPRQLRRLAPQSGRCAKPTGQADLCQSPAGRQQGAHRRGPTEPAGQHASPARFHCRERGPASDHGRGFASDGQRPRHTASAPGPSACPGHPRRGGQCRCGPGGNATGSAPPGGGLGSGRWAGHRIAQSSQGRQRIRARPGRRGADAGRAGRGEERRGRGGRRRW